MRRYQSRGKKNDKENMNDIIPSPSPPVPPSSVVELHRKRTLSLMRNSSDLRRPRPRRLLTPGVRAGEIEQQPRLRRDLLHYVTATVAAAASID